LKFFATATLLKKASPDELIGGGLFQKSYPWASGSPPRMKRSGMSEDAPTVEDQINSGALAARRRV